VGRINLGHLRASHDIPGTLKARITRLKNEKLKFYNNDPVCQFRSPDEVKHEEKRLFLDILDARQHKIQEELKALRRKIEGPQERRIRLDGTMEERPHQIDLQAAGYQKQVEALQGQIDPIKESRKVIETATEVPFVWDIAFVEVFEGDSQGFDIVIGNPPYVRQEAIAAPIVCGTQITTDKKEYKDKLARSVYHAFPNFFGYKPRPDTAAHKIDAKSDLYIYFYFHGLSLLSQKGSFCFITSNSWLDAGYGKDLQEFLLKHSQVRLVIDNQMKRSFASADVNTVVVLLAAPDDKRDGGLELTARFVIFKVPFEHIVSPVIFDEIEFTTDRKVTPEYRVFPVRQSVLLEQGFEVPEEPEAEGETAKIKRGPLIKVARYVGNKWGGKYLRAPGVFYRLSESGYGRTVPLGVLVRGQRYLNTGGANGFFIIKTFCDAPDARYYQITNNSKEGLEDGAPQFLIEKEFTHRLIKASNPSTLWITSTDALVLDIPVEQRGIRNTKAALYVKWGESKGFHKRSVTRLQRPWWKAPLQARESGPLLWLRYHHNVHKAYYNPSLFIGGDAFYRFYPLDAKWALPLVGILNSTYLALWKEICGATNYGLGVLGTRMDSMLRVPVPFPDDIGFQNELSSRFKAIAFRQVHPVETEKEQGDRRALDDLIFDYLGLSQGERDAVYEAVIGLVEVRLKKAGSV